jgi:hypothetical protein
VAHPASVYSKALSGFRRSESSRLNRRYGHYHASALNTRVMIGAGLPATESIAMLAGSADSPYDQAETSNVQSAARTLGLHLLTFNVTTESETATAELTALV